MDITHSSRILYSVYTEDPRQAVASVWNADSTSNNCCRRTRRKHIHTVSFFVHVIAELDVEIDRTAKCFRPVCTINIACVCYNASLDFWTVYFHSTIYRMMHIEHSDSIEYCISARTTADASRAGHSLGGILKIKEAEISPFYTPDTKYLDPGGSRHKVGVVKGKNGH